MTFLRALLLLAFGAAAAIAVDRLVLEDAAPARSVPPISGTESGPGDPPVVWLDGNLERIDDSELLIRVGQGPQITVERFAAGATSFMRLDGGEWVELTSEEIETIRPGAGACVETLLDGRTFLAIRVFLSAGCGPAPGP